MTDATGTAIDDPQALEAADEHIAWCRSEEFHPFEVLIAIGGSLKAGQVATWDNVRTALIAIFQEVQG